MTQLRRYWRQIVVIILWLMVLLYVRFQLSETEQSPTDYLLSLRAAFVDYWYGPALYFVAYILRPVLLFPATVLAVLAGAVWGVEVGFVYGLLAGTASSVLPYTAGRWLVRKSGPATGDAVSRMGRFARRLREQPFQSVLVMRLIYLPYDAVSFLAGTLKISGFSFFAATLVGNIGGTLSFVGVGASFEQDISEGRFGLDPRVLLFSGVVFILSLVISRLLHRYTQVSNVDAEMVMLADSPSEGQE